MKCLEHKLFNREELRHTNTNQLSWKKNTLTRLTETSNVAVIKIFSQGKRIATILSNYELLNKLKHATNRI